jgi:hypothetical protein
VDTGNMQAILKTKSQATTRENHENKPICTLRLRKYDFHAEIFLAVKGPAADATDAPQPRGLLCNPMMMKMKMMIIFCHFPSNGAPVE